MYRSYILMFLVICSFLLPGSYSLAQGDFDKPKIWHPPGKQTMEFRRYRDAASAKVAPVFSNKAINVDTIFLVTIARTGEVTRTELLNTPGNGPGEQTALKDLVSSVKLIKFPKLPSSYDSSSLTLTFRATDYRASQEKVNDHDG